MNVKINKQEGFNLKKIADSKYSINGVAYDADIQFISPNSVHIIINGASITVNRKSVEDNKNMTFSIDGEDFTAEIQDELDIQLEKMGINQADLNQNNNIEAPMPGLILDILVKEGDSIEKGTPMLILEAMKMENVIKSQGAGIVGSIHASKGQSVNKKDLLITFE